MLRGCLEGMGFLVRELEVVVRVVVAEGRDL